ncbi:MULTISPECIES: putative quinol monooxygenase [unclassified Yoonia]|uniref:putative quinol monooxygenase n=1 Tax=unclassified Yoonia TaxID=2629118 RepID=UPI002AFE0FBA|nr:MULTISPECIES: antibiotic biosynthesis monooxygenase [unclassified Yoonia]
MIRLSGQLICADAQQAAIVVAHLPEHIRLSRAEAGCLHFDVTPTDDPLVWQVDETFTDQAAFDLHQQRTRASEWWTATAAIRREFRVLGV